MYKLMIMHLPLREKLYAPYPEKKEKKKPHLQFDRQHLMAIHAAYQGSLAVCVSCHSAQQHTAERRCAPHGKCCRRAIKSEWQLVTLSQWCVSPRLKF